MSAAQMIPDLDGTGLDTGPQPRWIKASAKTAHLVHPRYLARAHTKAEMSAVVTQKGEPIVQGGEALTVGLVPVWRRFAIGPVIDGKAELLSQEDFVREDEIVYLDSFRFIGQRADDKDKRYIPNVRAFVSVKIDTRASGDFPRLCPLGTHIGPQLVKTGAQVYDAAKDEMRDRQMDETRAKLEAENAEQKARIEKLEAAVNALVGRQAEADAPPASAQPESGSALVTAKCGKAVDPRYMKNHVRFCKQGCKE